MAKIRRNSSLNPPLCWQLSKVRHFQLSHLNNLVNIKPNEIQALQTLPRRHFVEIFHDWNPKTLKLLVDPLNWHDKLLIQLFTHYSVCMLNMLGLHRLSWDSNKSTSRTSTFFKEYENSLILLANRQICYVLTLLWLICELVISN